MAAVSAPHDRGPFTSASNPQRTQDTWDFSVPVSHEVSWSSRVSFVSSSFCTVRGRLLLQWPNGSAIRMYCLEPTTVVSLSCLHVMDYSIVEISPSRSPTRQTTIIHDHRHPRNNNKGENNTNNKMTVTPEVIILMELQDRKRAS